MVKCLNLKSLSHCIKQQSIIYVIGWVIQLVENLISFFKSLFVSLASCKISLTLIVSEIFNFWFLFVNYIKVFKILFLNYFWCFKECKQLKMLVKLAFHLKLVRWLQKVILDIFDPMPNFRNFSRFWYIRLLLLFWNLHTNIKKTISPSFLGFQSPLKTWKYSS